MLIIGERINSTRESIARAINEHDVAFIQQEARQQADAGADYIDVNAGALLGEEVKYLAWLVKIVQEVVDKPLCIDTGNVEALVAALKLCQKLPIISSISAEKGRYQAFLPVIKGSGCKVVALCVDDAGIPANAESRVLVAGRLIDALVSVGVKPGDIYVDVLAQAVSAEAKAVITVLDTIRRMKIAYPDVNTVLGMSNVSFGLPNRRLLNQNFAVLCLEAGLDAAIADPLDRKLMASILSADVLLGRDKYGMNYSRAFRAGKLG